MSLITKQWIAPRNLFLSSTVFFGILIGELTNNFRLNSAIVQDSFHVGEYFSAERNLSLGNFKSGTVMIHGLVDVLPTALVRNVVGENRYIFPTWLAFQVLNFIAAVILANLLTKLISRSERGNYFLRLVVGIFSGCVGGYRDLVLLVLISTIYFGIILRNGKRQTVRVRLFSVIGFLTTFGIYWTWNRGLVSAVAVLVFIYSTKICKENLLWVLTGGVFGLFMVWIIYPEIILSGLIRNIFVLSTTSEQWGKSLSESKLVIVEIFILFLFLGKALFGSRNMLLERRGEVLFLSILLVGSLQWYLGRSDRTHMYSLLWISALVILRFYNSLKTSRKALILFLFFFIVDCVFEFLSRDWKSILLLGSFGILIFWQSPSTKSKLMNLHNVGREYLGALFALFAILFVSTFSNSDLGWIRNSSFLEENSRMVPPGIVWTAYMVNSSSSDCLLDFTNSGTLNALVRLPNCTEMAYLIYADSRFEDFLIQQINESNLEIIVWSSTFWSYSIDGKPMNIRFPKLAAFLEKNFPNTICEYDYCVRRKL